MIPQRFEYAAAASAQHAVELLADSADDTSVIGGGTWLVPAMNRGETLPQRVIDLGKAGLSGVERSNAGVRVGAMTSYSDVLASDTALEHLGLLATMAAGITGGQSIRHQGTLGGSAVAARPQSDFPAVASALGGEAVILGPGGERRIPPVGLFAGAMRTSLAADEILVGFEFPSRAGGHGYFKLKRAASSWPIATAAALMELDDAGRCLAVVLALGGVAAVPLLVDLDALLVGFEPDEERLRAAATEAAGQVTDPWGDVLAPPSYRVAVTEPVARRALIAALAHARRDLGGR